MPVWPVQPINERPSITLEDWSVYEVYLDGDDQPRTRHLVGYSLEDRPGQVSSAVERFDCENRCARTRSGRVYQLKGRPASNPDATYVWQWWKRLNGLTKAYDVTLDMAQNMVPNRHGE